MDIKALERIALSVRSLSMDAVEAANSGHPGLPLGCAELGAVLFAELLRHNPADPTWPARDRFVLSAGHGSMFLYSLLHLSGYDLNLDDIRNFRQLGYRTPGHPEYGHTVGVETTTGPLGQGLSNAVGMAIAERMSAARFNRPGHTIVDNYTYALAGDGCLMEGITSEASSLAGHLELGKLIVFYDSNRISIEGSTDLAFTEDVAARYRAYGWQVLAGDAYDMPAIVRLVELAKVDAAKPTLIILKSIIGKGSPKKQGTHEVHGAALGAEEIVATRRNLGLDPDQAFFVAPEAVEYFAAKREQWAKAAAAWQAGFQAWAAAFPELKTQWDRYRAAPPIDELRAAMPTFAVGDKLATRQAGGKALQAAAAVMANLVGGSADLAPSNNTALPYGSYTAATPEGRTLHFGVREHAMGAITNGIALYGGLRPFCATFLVFADYMRGAIRLSALMRLPVVFVFTHDSIFVGEDGPTHQPIEHLASLRVIPNMTVLRPGDAEETTEAWLMALEHTDGPTVLALTRQALPVYPKADAQWRVSLRQGAYLVRDTAGAPGVTIVATGSEVSLAVAAAEAAAAQGKAVRVVSVISRERFFAQPRARRQALVPPGVRTIVAEVGVSFGWESLVTDPADLFTIDRFGESGPAAAVAARLHVTQADLVALIMRS